MDADVVIVGSGAAGSVMAAKLAQNGKRVVILEAGPEWILGDLYSSQIWSRRIKWGGPLPKLGGNDPAGLTFNAGDGTGGSALHHYAVWLRLHPEDFELRSRYGEGQDWGISYETLRPFYDQVQTEVGISGDAGAEVWRPPGAAYPMPPLQNLTQSKIIQRGFEKLGLRTSPTPLAINSVEYQGRPPCLYDGWCDAGCPIGALANPLAVYLPQATNHGAKIMYQSTVSRVLTNAKGDRATGVEYFDVDGQKRVLNAKVVVLAAFTIQNPRILWNSKDGGLANSSGTLGQYVMAHFAFNVYGLFKDQTQNYLGVTGGDMIGQDGYPKDLHAKRGHLGSYTWEIGNAMKPNDLLGVAASRPDLFGNPLHAFMKTASQHLATMSIVGENLPLASSRITQSDRKDRYGMPLAQFDHDLAPDDLKTFEAARKEGQAVFKAAGATEQWVGQRAHQHFMGGTIMGQDPAASVTNSYGQTHDVANLFVAGPGLFATSGAVNPTFTLHALATRTARYLSEQWGSIV